MVHIYGTISNSTHSSVTVVYVGQASTSCVVAATLVFPVENSALDAAELTSGLVRFP